MNNLRIIISVLLGVFMLTSCDETPLDFDMDTEPTETNLEMESGEVLINSGGEETLYDGYGSLESDNSITTYSSGAIVTSWLGSILYIGKGVVYDIQADTFDFSNGGELTYVIEMSDDSMPIDTSLTLELNKAYTADLTYYDAKTLQEFEDTDRWGNYKGIGDESINLTISEIGETYFKGSFEGTYIDAESGEDVTIEAEFNIERVQ